MDKENYKRIDSADENPTGIAYKFTLTVWFFLENLLENLLEILLENLLENLFETLSITNRTLWMMFQNIWH